MIFSDKGMVFEEKLCEKVPVLKELTPPTSFSACARSLKQSRFVYILSFPSYSNQ